MRLVGMGILYPPTFPRHVFTGCVRSLERKGLVYAAYIEGGEVEGARLTSEGQCLLAENPKLSMPKDWRWIITTAIAAVGVAIALAALFISCTKFGL